MSHTSSKCLMMLPDGILKYYEVCILLAMEVSGNHCQDKTLKLARWESWSLTVQDLLGATSFFLQINLFDNSILLTVPPACDTGKGLHEPCLITAPPPISPTCAGKKCQVQVHRCLKHMTCSWPTSPDHPAPHRVDR